MRVTLELAKYIPTKADELAFIFQQRKNKENLD
jgi:hypothetical protein